MFGSEEYSATQATPQAAQLFSKDTSSEDEQTIDMVATALENGQLMLAFQPVMQARDNTKVAFYEGLIRVLDDAGDVVPAGAFMDVIEKTLLGRKLDTWALNEGLRTLFENPQLSISINMSALTISYAPWSHVLRRWLHKDETLAERLIIEITETAALSAPEKVIAFMHRLQVKGVSFAMDDFGAGYTALRHFKDFSFDILKIDGQFIKGISQCPDNQVVTAALVSIAKHFEMMIVAEFVETQEDAETLSNMGVDCLQGYHFGAPTMQPPWAISPQFAQAV